MFKILFLILFLHNFLFSLNLKTVNKVEYISVVDFNKELGLNGKWDPLKGLFKFEYPLGEVHLLAKDHFEMYSAGEFIDLKSFVIELENEWWIPTSVFTYLDSIGDNNIEIKEGKLNVTPKSDLRGIQIDPRSNGTLVTLGVNKGVKFENWFVRPHNIVRFNDFNPGDVKLDTVFTRGQIRNIKTFKESKSFQITFEVNHLVGDVELIDKSNEGKISLLFRRPDKKEKIKPVTKIEKPKIKRVIIDPGHGGKDHGAIGKVTNEKTIVLKVAKELKKKLEAKDFEAILTRSTDEFKTLKQRPEIASKKGGDLFISLHANAIDGDKKRKSEVKGFKVYILREAKSKADKAIARRENQFVDAETESHGKKELSPVDWIMLEHQLNLYTKESEIFANKIVNSFIKNDKNIRKHGTGAGQAGFYVLVGAFMPAVLFEMGFISNPEDEKYMMSDKGSKETARLMTEAVVDFDKSYGKQ